jgi:phage shock protein A
MSILKRMRDISIATLNEKLDQAEDPVRLIDRFLAAQSEQIAESEKLYKQVVEHAPALRH